MAPVVWAAQGGVVTSVGLPDDGVVDAGDRLVSVGLRPMVAAVGETPASRDLTVGLRGPDVEQLQEFLAEQGFSPNRDGVFRDATRRAVVAWQRSAGITPADGVVRFGDLTFFPELPTRLALSEGVAVGMPVAQGQALFDGAVGPADVRIVTSQDQARLIPTPFELTAAVGDHAWPGRMGAPWVGEDGMANIPIEAPDGGLVCGDECATALPLGRSVVVGVHVVVVPHTTGPLVPTSAIATDAGGSTHVLGDDGTALPVTVVASHGGLAVVEGLDVGARVQVFGDVQ